jgi:hypothetical protein
MRPLRVLTWHIHGSYLASLACVPHTWILPVRPGRPERYGGRIGSFDWPGHVVEVAAEDVASTPIDAVVYQTLANWESDRFEILSAAQRRLPAIYLEHDPPRGTPTDTRHPVDDPNTLLVHVTPFNALMWDSGRTPARVIDHGVPAPRLRWNGHLARGVTAVNGLRARGRRLGADVFELVASQVPIDLAGMGSEEFGGLGDLPRDRLAEVEADRRFFFNPIRYTSLGLAVVEAMHLGMPIVGLATTEMATAIQNGVSGWVDTDVGRLVEVMRALLADRKWAARLGAGAREHARERFGIERFVRDWDAALRDVTGTGTPRCRAATVVTS